MGRRKLPANGGEGEPRPNGICGAAPDSDRTCGGVTAREQRDTRRGAEQKVARRPSSIRSGADDPRRRRSLGGMPGKGVPMEVAPRPSAFDLVSKRTLEAVTPIEPEPPMRGPRP
jgi:hypothetical protein